MRTYQLSLPLLLCAAYTLELATAAQPRVPPRTPELPTEPAVREAIGPSDAALAVRRVRTELDVDAAASDDPALESNVATLEDAVAAQLRGDPLLGSRDIRVTVDRRSNTLTLAGEVASETEKQRATRVAASAFTAGHVRNRLRVRAD